LIEWFDILYSAELLRALYDRTHLNVLIHSSLLTHIEPDKAWSYVYYLKISWNEKRGNLAFLVYLEYILSVFTTLILNQTID